MNEKRIIIRCCRCRRIRLKGRWVIEDEEEVVRKHPVFSHSYCPDCMKRIQTPIEALPAPAVC